MKVAVTGASGFVGRAVMQGLRQRGYEPVGLSRRGPDISWDIATGPLSSPPEVEAVVHCAAYVRDGKKLQVHTAVNVEGTRNVLASFPRARIVHISSASVYDPLSPKHQVCEEAAGSIRWLNGYGETKWLAEEVVRSLRPDAAILRPHAVYGPGDTTLLPRILRARFGGRQLAIGDGENRITLTSIGNLVSGILATLEHPRATGAMNIGDAETPTVREVLEHLLQTLGLDRSIVWVPRRAAWGVATIAESLAGSREPLLSRYGVNQMSLEFTLCLDRARTELGWQPHETYRTAFRTLARLGMSVRGGSSFIGGEIAEPAE